MRVTLDTRYRLRLPRLDEPQPEVQALNGLLGLRGLDEEALARHAERLGAVWGKHASPAEVKTWASRLGPADVLHETVHRFTLEDSPSVGCLSYLLDWPPHSFEPRRSDTKSTIAVFELGIAEPLSRIVYRTPTVKPPRGLRPGVEIDVPSLAALAAFALERAVTRPDVHPLFCDSCKRFYFGRRRPGQAALCDRPAPGSGAMTCRQVGSQSRFRRERLAWDKARRAAFMRKERGTITEASYVYWRAEMAEMGAPTKFVPYEVWRESSTVKAREAKRRDEQLTHERKERDRGEA